MRTQVYIAAVLAMMAATIVFGVGATTVLTVPALDADAWLWLPVTILASLVAGPLIGWWLAPKVRWRPKLRDRRESEAQTRAR